MAMPGDNLTIIVELEIPVAINKGLNFSIHEGGRTVGYGEIINLLE